MSFQDIPHRRYNPLLGQWVKISPHRTKRPWQGQKESEGSSLPVYDPSCYLCPGNSRAGGKKNPNYRETFAFDNDFSALKPDAPAKKEESLDAVGLMRAKSERGKCRVLCFSPFHDRTIARMSVQEVNSVVSL